jgi:hypothetical protein
MHNSLAFQGQAFLTFLKMCEAINKYIFNATVSQVDRKKQIR